MTPSPAITAFLSLIAFSEGTIGGLDNGYGVIVTGIDGPHSFTDYSDHPFADGRPPIVVNHSGLTSTASGRYQLLLRWWEPYKKELSLPDFSPASQDAVAIQQMRERGAVGYILAGNIQQAIQDCSNIWASFPGNDYGQAGGHTMGDLLEKYTELSA